MSFQISLLQRVKALVADTHKLTPESRLVVLDGFLDVARRAASWTMDLNVGFPYGVADLYYRAGQAQVRYPDGFIRTARAGSAEDWMLWDDLSYRNDRPEVVLTVAKVLHESGYQALLRSMVDEMEEAAEGHRRYFRWRRHSRRERPLFRKAAFMDAIMEPLARAMMDCGTALIDFGANTMQVDDGYVSVIDRCDKDTVLVVRPATTYNILWLVREYVLTTIYPADFMDEVRRALPSQDFVLAIATLHGRIRAKELEPLAPMPRVQPTPIIPTTLHTTCRKDDTMKINPLNFANVLHDRLPVPVTEVQMVNADGRGYGQAYFIWMPDPTDTGALSAYRDMLIRRIIGEEYYLRSRSGWEQIIIGTMPISKLMDVPELTLAWYQRRQAYVDKFEALLPGLHRKVKR